jgi:hypothetical protein
LRRVLPLLLVLATVAPQAALAGAWYLCRTDRVARASCCCPVRNDLDDRAREAPARAELRPSPCCDVVDRAPGGEVARVESSARPSAPEMTAAIVPVELALPPARVTAVAARATAPPSIPSDPLYLRLATLLL